MNLAARLRDVVGTVRRPGSAPAEGPADVRRPGSARDSSADPAEQLGGEWRDRYVVIDTKFSPGYRHGHTAVADCLPPDDGMWPMLPLLAGPEGPALRSQGSARLVFVDLETTGLAGGAGTCAFLVGCGWFDGASFRIQQFFLASHAGERALLDGVAEVAAGATGVVTYNGRSFDLPLMETRFLFHRMATPFAGLPHVDMLHAARRLWRGDGDEGCRLTSMEETLLGHVREGDVPRFEIPARYFHSLRTSDARPLHAVLEHNRLDLLALALMTARAAGLLESGAAAAASAREALGLGRLYERAGRTAEARDCYARAPDLGGSELTHAEALRALAVTCRRARRHDEAAAAWRRLLDLRRCPPRVAREATEALAIHHEHRTRDLQEAHGLALELQDHHRLARLKRKLGASLLLH
jgi:tetratricopeptide (TPR) repeat protein